jgi:type II secretory pathway pseudopilin PulG
MNRSFRTATVITLIVVALLVGILVAGEFRNARRAAEESAQRALLIEATQLLANYIQKHGKYPESLKELAFTYPDGGDDSLLSKFKYESDGKRYSLTTVGTSTGKELKISSDE